MSVSTYAHDKLLVTSLVCYGKLLRYTLTCASIADDHDGVSDLDQFLQLHHLENKVILGLKTQVLGKEREGKGGRGRGKDSL